MGLKQKMECLFIIMMVSCVFFCFFIFYMVSNSRMTKDVENRERTNQITVSKNVEETLENINHLSWVIMENEEIREYLKADTISGEQEAEARQTLHRIINTFGISCNITLFRKNTQYVNTGPGILQIRSGNIRDNTWMHHVEGKKGGYLIQKDTGYVFKSNIGGLITFARVINDPNTQEEIGFVAIHVSDYFFDKCLEGLADESNQFAILDRNGEIFSGNMKSEMIFEGDQYPKQSVIYHKTPVAFEMKYYEPIPKAELMIVSYTKGSLVEGASGSLVFWFFLGGMLLLMLIWLIRKYITRHVTRPIRTLSRQMTIVRHGRFQPFEMELDDDEIGQLKDSYNEMIVEIDNLLKETKEKEEEIRAKELMAFQEQIKPHFLYNTLDMIRGEALAGEGEKVNEMLETLGNFYRTFLNRGSESIPLKNEFEIVTNYLKIQNWRFGKKFETTMELEDELEDFMVPRLILQPLVENSINHGILPKGEPGRIEIRGFREGTDVILSIYDNGIGMSDSEKEQLEGDQRETSFGFYATMQRIRHYYHRKDVCSIHTREGEFCEIVIRIPYEKEKKEKKETKEVGSNVSGHARG